MSRKRLAGIALLILICSLGWGGYRAMHRSMLNHELILASAAGNPGAVRRLLLQGANPNALEERSLQSAWERFLHLFLHQQQAGASLCPLSQALINETPNANRIATIRLLLEQGANPNLKLGGDISLPIKAIRMGGNEENGVPALFLQHGADPNAIDEDGASRSCMLLYAVHAHRWKLVQFLLEHGANPNLANTSGDTALMWAAYEQNLGILQLLLAHGADVNHTNYRGQSALAYALTHPGEKQSAMIERLLAAGADVNLPNRQGYSPFLLALLIRCPGTAAMLAHGGDVHKATPLSAPTESFIVTMRLWHSSELINTAVPFVPGARPLMLAVQAHNADLVRGMLAKGANK